MQRKELTAAAAYQLAHLFANMGKPSLGVKKKDTIRCLFREERMEKVNRISRSAYAQIGFFLLFLAPGIPKDMLCYVAGLSPMGFGYFMLVSGLGRLPGIAGCALMGTAVAEQRWTLFALLAGLSVGLFAAGLVFRERIHRTVARVARPEEKLPDPSRPGRRDDARCDDLAEGR